MGRLLPCDMCECVPALTEPMCVKVCGEHALTYVEREVERHEKPQKVRGEIEGGLESLVNQYRMEAVIDRLQQMSKGQGR